MRKRFTGKDLITGVKFKVEVYYYKYTDRSVSIEWYTLDRDDISPDELISILGKEKMDYIMKAVLK
jgi:hypothetical protein